MPHPSDSNPTFPAGVLAVPAAVSLTVAVQVDGVASGTAPGEQLTLVEVERCGTASVSLPLLAAWVGSPS